MGHWQYVCSVVLLVFTIQSKAETDEIKNQIIEVFNYCKCVRYYQCDENGTINESGKNLIDIRIGNNKNKERIKCKGGKFDGDYVCCKLRSNLVIGPKNPDDPTTEKNYMKIACGEQRPIINDRIFATDESEMYPVSGEFPWIAAIFIKNDNSKKYEFSFSGSLIHPKVILTAAHKVHGKRASKLKVVVNGELELPVIGNNKTEERNVEEIIRHEDFNSIRLYNDVALLILDEPYIISKRHVNRICLPPGNIDLEGTQCVVAGWGEETKPLIGEPKVLKKVMVPFVEHSKCQDQLRRTRLGRRFRLHKTFMCAGGEKDKDSCKGDGGSPLMCPFAPGEPRYFQAGIVAWGVGCGQENVPGVYANVKEFKEWIKNKLLSKHIDIE